DPFQPVTGIVATLVATDEVIDQAIQLKANLIISHETIFYDHPDKVDWLDDDAVYKAKRRKIEAYNLVIWRLHDHIHKMQPDLTVVGLVKALGWENYTRGDDPISCEIPPVTLQQLVLNVKEKLGISYLRVTGNLNQSCRGIAILPGFMGRDKHIE